MPKIMWRPSSTEIEKSQLNQFMRYIQQQYGLNFHDYFALYQWSISAKAHFWKSVWEFCRVKASSPPKQILITGDRMQDTKWFQGSRLNFAENLLSRRDEKLALVFNNENGQRRTLTYLELYEAVAKVSAYLRNAGLTQHDRVVGLLPNIVEAIICMLATISLGAIWSSCSPDFGSEALFDRLHQIAPKVLFTCDGYFYNGKIFSTAEKIKSLQNTILSLKKTVCINYTNQNNTICGDNFAEILCQPVEKIKFAQLPFDHPVYIMFSSGTTATPKCIVHGAGGTLLQHLKELVLHVNLTAEDSIFYYTTCGWMMWNWYVSSLATGATVIQYDGSPFYPNDSRLLDFIDEEKITVFGTSAKYLNALEKKELIPKATHNLGSLRSILSTGSVLMGKNYDYVYQHLKTEVCLSSISGGTDIISCFALGNPLLPVYRGELQCIGLGMNVKIFNDQGNEVINEKGELVCKDPFPSMPLYFWNDTNGEKYHQAYFTKYPNVWAHGDFAKITERDTVVIYGRSDATLNPGGIRIGTAEIYRQVEKIPEVVESLAVSQEWDDDSRILLFVILKNDVVLTDELIAKIKNVIRRQASPHHVPAKVIAVPDIPRTLSGKIVELAVREIIHNRPVKNISAIQNPECLAYFKLVEKK